MKLFIMIVTFFHIFDSSGSIFQSRYMDRRIFHISLLEEEARIFRRLWESSRRKNESIHCPEIGTTFTNDPPFDVLGVPECGDYVRPKMRLYLPEENECELDPFYLPNKRTTKCLTALKEKRRVKKVVWIIHGFLKDFEDEWMHVFQREIMKLDPETAAIIVGWGGGLFDIFHYWRSAANVRYISQAMYGVLKELREIVGEKRNAYIHCIGHSLGGHACGLLGRILRIKGEQLLDRISGLDPAGPLFCNDVPYPFNKINASRESRLDSKDAEYVDVIHTDGHARYFGYIPQYGTLESLGHVDFYPGTKGLYGQYQPGCDDVFDVVSCSHTRAHEIYGSSIYQAVCLASRICHGDPHTIPKDCKFLNKTSVIMGYWIDPKSPQLGEFTVEITGKSPYCL